jgi:hypothetical protein
MVGNGDGKGTTLVTLAEDCPFSHPAIDSMSSWSKSDLGKVVVVLREVDRQSRIAVMASDLGLRTVFVSASSKPPLDERLFARTPWRFVVDSSGVLLAEGSWNAVRK